MKAYYVDCTGNQALRDELLDYAVERGAKYVGGAPPWQLVAPHAAMSEMGVYPSIGSTPLHRKIAITPATWKRKVRKIWGGKKATKPAQKKAAPKKRKPTQLDRIEALLNKLESSVAALCSGASFMQELEQDAPSKAKVLTMVLALNDEDYEWLRRQIGKIPEQEVRIGNDLGLTPAKEPEPWKPSVGEWVVVERDSLSHGLAGRAGNVGGFSRAGSLIIGGMYVRASDCRPATPEEVQAHLAAEEAKKTPKLGDRVKYHGCECEVVSRLADADGVWTLLSANERGYTAAYWAKRSEFTIID